MLKPAPETDRRYAETFGNAADSSYTITHNLGSADVMMQVIEVASGAIASQAYPAITNANTVTVTTIAPPGDDALRIIITA